MTFRTLQANILSLAQTWVPTFNQSGTADNNFSDVSFFCEEPEHIRPEMRPSRFSLFREMTKDLKPDVTPDVKADESKKKLLEYIYACSVDIIRGAEALHASDEPLKASEVSCLKTAVQGVFGVLYCYYGDPNYLNISEGSADNLTSLMFKALTDVSTILILLEPLRRKTLFPTDGANPLEHFSDITEIIIMPDCEVVQEPPPEIHPTTKILWQEHVYKNQDGKKEVLYAPSNIKIGRVLGRGGMATVYSGEMGHYDLESGDFIPTKTIAVKISGGIKRPDDSFLDNDQAIQDSFKIEQTVLALINHPNVIRVDTVGVTSAGNEFMVLEKALTSFADYLVSENNKASTDIGSISGFLRQIAEGLAVTHKAGFAHRDIKASNVLLIKRGEQIVPVVSDYGTAEKILPNIETKTVVGMPTNMSPEILILKELMERLPKDCTNQDAASAYDQLCSEHPWFRNAFECFDLKRMDVFQFGLLCYAALSRGQHPYLEAKDHNQKKLIRAYKDSSYRTLCHRDGISPTLDGIIEKCLKKDPSERYANMEEVLRDLKKFDSGPGFETSYRSAYENLGDSSPNTCVGILRSWAEDAFMSENGNDQEKVWSYYQQLSTNHARSEEEKNEFLFYYARHLVRSSRRKEGLEIYSHIRKSLEMLTSTDAIALLVDILIEESYFSIDDPEKAFHVVGEAATLIQTNNISNKTLWARCYLAESSARYRLGDFDEALDKANEAQKIYSGLQDNGRLVTVQSKIGNILLEIGRSLIESGDSKGGKSKLEESIFILEAAKQLADLHFPRGQNVITVEINLADAHMLSGNYDLAANILENSLSKTTPSQRYYVDILKYLGRAYQLCSRSEDFDSIIEQLQTLTFISTPASQFQAREALAYLGITGDGSIPKGH